MADDLAPHFGFSNPRAAVEYFVLRSIPETIPTSAPDGWASFRAVDDGLAAAIENLIDIKNYLPGNGDSDAEPSLSATTDLNQEWGWTEHCGGEDLEDEFDGREDGHDAEQDESDREWSLGWTNDPDQSDIADQVSVGDREGPDDDREPEDGL